MNAISAKDMRIHPCKHMGDAMPVLIIIIYFIELAFNLTRS